MKISIVVPLYNEEKTIINILSKIQNDNFVTCMNTNI